MSSNPLSVFIGNRPIRVAFLVNPDGVTDKQLDAIMQYSLVRWGGRYSPIIFTDGGEIDDQQWKFLYGYDPDIIAPLVQLKYELTEKINIHIAPLTVEDYRKPEGADRVYSVDTPYNGLLVYPSRKNLTPFVNTLTLIGEPKLIMFELEDVEDIFLKKFIYRNLGVYNKAISIENAIKHVETITFRITGVESLTAALTKLSDLGSYVYPIQLSTLPSAWPKVIWDHPRDAFTIVVGDTLKDITHAWNHPLTLAEPKRKGINEIWLPLNLARDHDFLKVFPYWIRRLFGARYEQDHPVLFVSHSLTRRELEEIVNEFKPENEFYPTSCKVFAQAQTPDFERRTGYVDTKRGVQLFTAIGNSASIPLSVPGGEIETMGNRYWMSDIHIQDHPKHSRHTSGKIFWWQLPRKNDTARQLLRRETRINIDHFPSALLHSGDSTLNINLISELDLFSIMIARHDGPYKHVSPSDKGRYLSGILELFSGLDSAYMTLRDKYWRTAFQAMSLDESNAQIATRNKVGKLLDRLDKNRIDKESAIEKIINVARSAFKKGRELTFDDFIKAAEGIKEEIELLHIEPHIEMFTESNILRVGLRPRCDRCGYRIWYHIDEVRQFMRCVGCGYKFALKREDEKWYYKLNSLFQVGIAEHGSLPVILTLGKLLDESKTSFFFAPSLNLFDDPEKKPLSDLDIVCVQDGKLIIGEVKESDSLYETKNFTDMERIAKEIRPDVVIFSALNVENKSLVKKQIERLSNELRPLGIDVLWYPC